MFKFLPKSLAAASLAIVVALSGTAASTSQAHADNDNLRTFLGAAAGLIILGNIIDSHQGNRYGNHYYAPAPVTRHYAPVTPRLVAPSSCFSRFQGPNVNIRGFGAHCLFNQVPHRAYLPNSCRERVFTYQGWRDVYDAQCLYSHGWVRS